MEEVLNSKSEIATDPIESESQPSQTGWDFGSLMQFISSGLAALILLGLAALFIVQGVMLKDSGEDSGASAQVLSALLLASGMGFGGLLMLPSTWFSLLRLTGRRPISTLPGWFPRQGVLLALLLIVEPLALVVGSSLASATSPAAWLLLPPIHLLTVTVPIIWLIHLGCYGLPYGIPQRKWGVFASGLALGPGIIIGLEIAAGMVMAVGVLLMLASQPGLIETLQQLVQQITENPALSPEQVAVALTPYAQKPIVIYAAVAFLAVIVPLLEELLKPIGVWLLAGRSLTVLEGFVAGVLSGAGFALMENLGYSAAGGGDWAVIVLARAGTAVMHITTAAMLGWALSATWRDGRYVRVAATYVAAVIIHGLWNGITVSFGLLGTQFTEMQNSAITFQLIASTVLGLLLLSLLIGMNSALRRAEALHRAEALRNADEPQRHAIMPTSVSSGDALPPAETILSNEENPDDGTSASTG